MGSRLESSGEEQEKISPSVEQASNWLVCCLDVYVLVSAFRLSSVCSSLTVQSLISLYSFRKRACLLPCHCKILTLLTISGRPLQLQQFLSSFM